MLENSVLRSRDTHARLRLPGMMTGFGWYHGIALLLAAVLLVLVCWVGSVVSSRLVDTRSAALFDAERAIAQAISPRIQQDRVPPALGQAAERLLAEPALGLSYITLRNANSVVLVSRGGFGDRFDWLSANQGREWRSLLYRLTSAEANRPVMRDEQQVGYARFGVGWMHVLSRAGAGFALWCLVLLIALGGFCWALARALSPSGNSTVKTANSAPGKSAARRPPVARAPSEATANRSDGSAPLSRLARRPHILDDGYAPIGEPETLSSTANNPGGSSGNVVDLRPTEAQPEPASSTPDEPAEQSSGSAEVPPAFANVIAAAPTPFGASDHGPEIQGQPTLDDSTLDLRFFPIWRDRDQQRLAGAWALLAWRSGNGEPVYLETLTDIAVKADALRDFTEWFARRFSMLHSNWRALELATVPILLPVPDAMLDFTDADTVWRDALERGGRDVNDLILRVSQAHDLPGAGVLPARRSIDLESLESPSVVSSDVLCVHPNAVSNVNADEWREIHDALQRPVILGPITDPEAWAHVIDHERVSWYSDATTPDNLHTPRTFARLLSRAEVEPI